MRGNSIFFLSNSKLLRHFHPHQAHVVRKLVTGGKLRDLSQQLREQLVAMQTRVIAHTLQQKLLAVLLVLSAFHLEKTSVKSITTSPPLSGREAVG